jgi:cysteine desulfurase/selenocysteine lyase
LRQDENYSSSRPFTCRKTGFLLNSPCIAEIHNTMRLKCGQFKIANWLLLPIDTTKNNKMNISTLNNIVYSTIENATNNDWFADNNVADADNINAGENLQNINKIRPFVTPSQITPNSQESSIPFVETNVLANGIDSQTLLPADYMNDFFIDQSPFVTDQIVTAKTPVAPIPHSPPPSHPTPPSPSISTLLPSDQVAGIDWDVFRVEREISRTLYNNGLEEIPQLAFDLADNNSRNTIEVGEVKKTEADVNLILPASDQLSSQSFDSSAVQSSYFTGGFREFDVVSIRREFPILSGRVHGRPLIWFDNGATTQKPRVVIERLRYFYEHENSNVHRGAHDLAARSTDAYERSREVVRKFLNASSSNEIVFVRGTTEAINLVSAAWGRDNIHAGDEIVISYLEHHANIVPWQVLASEVGAVIRVIPVNSDGDLLISNYTDILRNGKTKLVAVTQVSNAIGTITPTEEIVKIAHQFGAKVLVDGAQSVPHFPTDVQMLDADFFVFSGHKIFAPTGIGILYGKESILNSMRPYQSGGGMISDVTFERTSYNPAPSRFEAGTGNIADAVGLGAALDYVGAIGLESIRQYEHRLLEYALAELNQIAGVRIIGNAANRAAVISFLLEGFTTDEINKILATEGIAVRAGHHCAQPILRYFGLESTVRASLAFYNTFEEIDFLVKIIKNIAKKSQW